MPSPMTASICQAGALSGSAARRALISPLNGGLRASCSAAATADAIVGVHARDELVTDELPLRRADGAAERRAHERHDAVAVDLDDEIGLHVGQQLQALAQPTDLLVVDGLHVRLADEEQIGHRPRLAALDDRPQGDAHPDPLAVRAAELLLEDLLAVAAKAAGALGPPGHDAGPLPSQQIAARAAHESEQRRVESDRLADVRDHGDGLLQRQVRQHLEHDLDALAHRRRAAARAIQNACPSPSGEGPSSSIIILAQSFTVAS